MNSNHRNRYFEIWDITKIKVGRVIGFEFGSAVVKLKDGTSVRAETAHLCTVRNLSNGNPFLEADGYASPVKQIGHEVALVPNHKNHEEAFVWADLKLVNDAVTFQRNAGRTRFAVDGRPTHTLPPPTSRQLMIAFGNVRIMRSCHIQHAEMSRPKEVVHPMTLHDLVREISMGRLEYTPEQKLADNCTAYHWIERQVGGKWVGVLMSKANMDTLVTSFRTGIDISALLKRLETHESRSQLVPV